MISPSLNFVDLNLISSFIRAKIQLFKKKSLARQTYVELNKLGDKELKDIGISRGDIRSIAEEVFYDDRFV